MGKKKKRGMTRRKFIKSTAAASAGAVAATGSGLFGKEKAIAFTSASQPNKCSWETPPDPIPDSKIKKKFTTDIVIIGCGVSGATASASATEAGAKVIIIEKHTMYNCRGSDNAAIDSRVQKKLGVKVDKDEVCLALQKYAGNRTDQRLLRLWANNSGRILDWIGDMLEPAGFQTTLAYWPEPEGYGIKTELYPQFPVCHNYSGGMEGLVKTLIANAFNKGAEFHYNTRAVQLIRKDKGRVTEVVAQDKDGNYVQYNANKGVILCTGDYGHDDEMMKAYCPWVDEEEAAGSPYNPPVNTGDGHKMGMWIGGLLEPPPHAPVDHSAGGPRGVSAFLHVNTLGERYENEDVDGQVIANAMKRQTGHTCWQVFDSKWEDEIDRMGFGFLKGSFGGKGEESASAGEAGAPPGESIDSPVFAAAADAGAFGNPPEDGATSGAPPQGENVQAYTIDELARKMRVPVDTFKKTVERYNYLARLGRDLDLGKRVDRLTTVDKPPFYAGQALIGFLVTLGGFYVNTRLQMLDEERKPIEGIYLAGNTVGNRFANDYPLLCPGLSHAFAWTTGYLAAKSACGIPDPAWKPKMA